VLKEGFGWQRILAAFIITTGVFVLQIFG
jgi:hypothetical protein